MSEAATTPSFETGMLAYARSVQITEGLFYATAADNAEKRTPVEVFEKGVRGQSSQYNAAKKAGLSNPQSVDCAIIPQGHDGAELSFSLRFMPLSMRPHACNNTRVAESYRRLAEGYKTAGGFRVLAALYVWNLANARFAWRNRFQSDAMSVTVRFNGKTLRFDPLLFDLEKSVGEQEMADGLLEGDAGDLAELIDGIADGLSDPECRAFNVQVTWNASMQAGQEIFPSQEYVRDEKADNNLSRVYAKLPTQNGARAVMQASLHSQKIGAALRHIDIWHDSDEHHAPVAVNPYGGVQETSAVLRKPKSGRSFYDIRSRAGALMKAVEAATGPEELTGEAHFVMANLVRGGVFGKKEEE